MQGQVGLPCAESLLWGYVPASGCRAFTRRDSACEGLGRLGSFRVQGFGSRGFDTEDDNGDGYANENVEDEKEDNCAQNCGRPANTGIPHDSLYSRSTPMYAWRCVRPNTSSLRPVPQNALPPISGKRLSFALRLLIGAAGHECALPLQSLTKR